MSNPTVVTINPVLRTGYVDLFFDVSYAPVNSTIDRLVVITNDNRSTADTPAGTGMVETERAHLDSAGQPVNKVVLTSAMVPAGKLVFVTLQVYFNDVYNTVVSSETKTVIATNIPQAPLDNNSIIREDDKGLSINIGYVYPDVMGTADGYSKIMKAIVYISKVGGTSGADFITKVVTIGNYTDSNGKATYNTMLPIGVELLNSTAYEVAFRVVNGLGQSALSKTYIKTPKDFPAQVNAPLVYTLFGNQSRLGQTLIDPSGSVVVYFRRPSDYDDLIASGTPVQKYIVNEYFGSNSVNTYDLSMNAAGVPTSTNANWSITTATDYFYNSIDDSGYHYKFTINGNPASRLGNTYKYRVIAVNINGQSPESNESNAIKTFILPAAQTIANCALLHTQADGATINNGVSYKKYTGDMTMRISALSSTNSGNEYMDSSSNPIYKLDVTDISLDSNVYSDEVTFIRSAVTPATNPVTYVYNLDFANVTKNVDSVFYTLNQLLVKGKKYKFELKRLSLNPNDSNIKLSSSALRIDRTPFSSPGKIKFCESYAYNDNLTPVTTTGGSKAIRVLFGRLLDAELAVCGLTPALIGTEALYDPSNNKFAAIRYNAFQSSLPVYVTPAGELTTQALGKQLSISHYPITNDPYVFTVPLADYGQLTANYIRVELYNIELGVYINADESSPAVSEKALSYVGPPTALTVTTSSETSINIAYTKQTNLLLNGNAQADVSNRVLVVRDSNNIVVKDEIIPYSSSPSLSVSGLTTGLLYRVYVIAETYYSRRKYNSVDENGQPDNVDKLFDNVVIRSATGVVTTNVQMTGIPTAPTSIEYFSTDTTITAYYDAPAQTHGVTNLYYHIYAWINTISRPNFSIANSAGTQEITISKGALTALETLSTASALSKTAGTYSVAMQVIGKIGNVSIANTSYEHKYDAGKINDEVVDNYITLTSPVTLIPEQSVSGLLSLAQDIVIHDAITVPPNVAVRSSEGTLVVSFDKVTPMTDIIISVDESDALDYVNSPVATFDTRPLRALALLYLPSSQTQTNDSGLYFLEEYTYTFTAQQKAALTDPQKVLIGAFDKYNFERQNISGTTRYSFTFSGLKNALPYKFSTRYCKKFDTYDAFSQSSVITGSAEAAPSLITSPTFTVDSNTIIAKWQPPTSKGSESALLKYTVSVVNEEGESSTLPTIDAVVGEVAGTVYTSTINNLIDGNSYTVFVNAFYNKLDGTAVTGTQLSINANGAIKPRAKPVGAILSSQFASNSITAVITPPIGDERTNYPLNGTAGLILSVRHLSSPSTTKQQLKTWTNQEYLDATAPLSFTATSFSAGLIVHGRPLNAFNYEFVLEYVPAYTYAQAISSSSVAVTPSGPAAILSANTTDAGKKLIVTVNLNGSGAISNIVGLAKTSGSNSIVVRNLPAGSFPSDFNTGGNSTAFTHSGQISTFTLDYGFASAISDHLTVITTANSSDTLVGGASFFT